MPRVIDVHNRLAPSLWFFRDYWEGEGVAVEDAGVVLALATGAREVNTGRAEAWQQQAEADAFGDEEARLILQAWGPGRVVRDLVLGGRPGLILLEAGPLRDPGEGRPVSMAAAQARINQAAESEGPIALSGPLRLFGGQCLQGIGAAEGGTRLDFVGTGPGGLQMEGSHAVLRDLFVTNASAEGIVCRSSSAVIERVRVEARVPLRILAANSVSVRHGVLIGSSPADPAVQADLESNHATFLGCHIVAQAYAVRIINAPHAALVRCRLERRSEGGSSDLVPAPLVALLSDGCAVVGCHLSTAARSTASVQVGNPSTPRDVLLEKNLHDDGAGGPAPTAMLQDGGTGTLFRDLAERGFPPVSLSTWNYLQNSSFDVWESVMGRAMPISWRSDPLLNWKTRAEFFANQVQPTRAFDRTKAPDGLQFGNWPVQPPWQRTIPADALYDGLADLHLGSAALWVGLRGRAIRGSFEQGVTLPLVAREFVLSAFVKAKGVGEVFLELGEPAVRSVLYAGGGGWQQLTIRYRPVPAGGEAVVPVRCVVRSGSSTQSVIEAVFDRLMLVAGSVVPHHADRCLEDVGGPAPVMRTKSGRFAPVTLAPGRGEGRALAVVDTEMELAGDAQVSWRVTDGLTQTGRLQFSIDCNDKPVLVDAGATALQPRGEYVVGRIPRTLFQRDHFSVGDLLRLRAPPWVEELRVVLPGRTKVI